MANGNCKSGRCQYKSGKMETATENGKQQRNSEQQCDATIANEKL